MPSLSSRTNEIKVSPERRPFAVGRVSSNISKHYQTLRQIQVETRLGRFGIKLISCSAVELILIAFA